MQHRSLIALVIAVIAFNLPAPANASEVVKLARLVLTGKRVAAEPQHREPTPVASDKSAPTPATGAVNAQVADTVSSGSAEPSTSNVGTSMGGGAHGQAFLRPF
ncbi:MAG TPA: hypothetical protein VGM81_19495 [Burkholderiaceae bacterium]|jgi:hypothetical protein